MVNISSALSSQKIQAYHKTDYANSTQKSYYSQDGEIAGTWHGKLAEEMGLSGHISAEHFNRLAEGQDPHSGEQLVRHRMATDDSVAHRAGWDATFSAPKSVSITALVGGDQRILDAHREAVKKSLDYLERSVHARIGGNNAPEHTGKWAAATFEHDTSRPVNGYSAPQLHTHAVFFNVTKTADGRSRALDPRPIFEAQKAATALYQAELGYRLRQLGYDLEEGKGGAREIKGYTQDYLKANSSRSEQIEELAKHLQEQGLNRAEARQRAAHATREAKGRLLPEQTRAQQKELAHRFGNQHDAIIRQARAAAQHVRQEMTEEQAAKAACIAVIFSRDKNFERDAVVSQQDVFREALRRGQDITTPAHIDQAIQAQTRAGDLLPVKGRGNQPAYTTPEMVALEGKNIHLMKAGQNQYRPFLPEDSSLQSRIDRHFHQFEQDAAKQSNPARRQQLEAAIQNQKDAIRQILTSRDQVQAFQGAAGTGKTTSLTIIRKELEAEGLVVRGFAPTSRASQQLAECGAECSTLQMHLIKPPERHPGGAVCFVDETSLASAKQINEFLTRLQPTDRVILIGDVRQHEAIDAGRAFAQLQEHGIRTARLAEIVRQKDQALRQAVERLAAGKVPEAVELLKQQGRVSQIESEPDRFRTISREYLKDRAGTLVVSPDNRSRAAINSMVHQELKRSGAIHQKDQTVTVLVNRQDVTGADRTWAKSYETGNVLRYSTGSKKLNLEKGEFVTVIAVNAAKNEVTVQKKNGQTVAYNPQQALRGASLYRREERAFAAGERIQFTAPFRQKKGPGIANREFGAIKSISGGDLIVTLDSGRTVQFNIRDHANLDYGYAVTSQSSQGLTTNRVLVNIDTERTNRHLINERLAYVAVSRARHDAHIYTNNSAALGVALSRDVSKSSALTIDGRIRHLADTHRASQSVGAVNGHTPAHADQARTHTGPVPVTPGHQHAVAPIGQQQGASPAQLSSTAAPKHPAGNGPMRADHGDPTPTPAKPGSGQGHGYGIEQSKTQEHRMEQAEEEGFGF